MSQEIPRYHIAVYTPDQTLPTMIPSIDSFGDIMAGRIEDIREVYYADGCTCFHCGTLVGGTTSIEIGENLTTHYRECEKHPLAIENRELRKALWWYTTDPAAAFDDYADEIRDRYKVAGVRNETLSKMHADLVAEADELRKVLWWYAEATAGQLSADDGANAIEVLQRFPGDKEKKVVFEGVQPK